MPIIIKEIIVKTIIEDNHSVSEINENQKKQLKEEIMRDVEDFLKEAVKKNIKR